MNWTLSLVASAALCALGLASCQGPATTGTVIRNPTVEDMARLDASMGLPPVSRPKPAIAAPGVSVPESSALPTYNAAGEVVPAR